MILRADTLAWLLAVPLALGLSSCSSPPSTTGGDFGGGGTPSTGGTGGNAPGTTGGTTGGSGNTGGSTQSPGAGATPASTGTTSGTGTKPASGSSGSGSGSQSGSGAGSSSGSKPGTSSSGAGPGAGSSGGAGASSGAGSSGAGGSGAGSSGGMGATGPLGRITGCGQATSCTPASDLAPPTNGVQFSLPDGSVTVQPGQEAYYCYWNTLQQATTVGAFQSWMSPGSSHHFIVFEEQAAHPDGSVAVCGFGSGNWRYATSVSGQIIELKFPDTVGLQIPAGEQIDMNMHFINPGSTATNPQIKLNVVNAVNVQNYATSMISFNAQINIPAASALGPGTQTVNGTCTAPSGANFFALTTHTHKWATSAQVNLVRGGQTTNVVNTTNWEAPDVALWNGPTWLTMGPGDSFTYSCSYSNSGATPITVGDTAANNEMCMAIGYFFPAGQATCF